MSKIIALANQKGGVTKTTSTYNISFALSLQGRKVLMIDLDPQASLTIMCGLEPEDENMKRTIDDALRGACEFEECIIQLNDNLDIVTSIIDLAATESELQGRKARETILKRCLRDIKERYDYILIDCPPQLSLLTLNALTACNVVVIPCATQYLAYRGLEQLYNTIQEVKDLPLNENIEIIGVFATLYEKSVKDHNEILNAMKEKYDVIGTVRKTAKANKGMYAGLPVVAYDPKSEIAAEYFDITEKIEKKLS